MNSKKLKMTFAGLAVAILAFTVFFSTVDSHAHSENDMNFTETSSEIDKENKEKPFFAEIKQACCNNEKCQKVCEESNSCNTNSCVEMCNNIKSQECQGNSNCTPAN